ncbi:MAG: TRAP transporter small permease [Pseudooceanicola sp.]
MLSKILRIWTRIETILIGCLIITALVIFLGGAVLRAVAPGHAVDWAEEVSLYCIVWATVLAGSSLVAEGRHINTEIFVTALPTRYRLLLGWAMTLLAAGFCTAMMIFGWQAYEFALLLDERSASSLRTPQGYAVFLALPVGMALILGRIAMMILMGERPFSGETHLPQTGKP